MEEIILLIEQISKFCVNQKSPIILSDNKFSLLINIIDFVFDCKIFYVELVKLSSFSVIDRIFNLFRNIRTKNNYLNFAIVLRSK